MLGIKVGAEISKMIEHPGHKQQNEYCAGLSEAGEVAPCTSAHTAEVDTPDTSHFLPEHSWKNCGALRELLKARGQCTKQKLTQKTETRYCTVADLSTEHS